jgi:hypothetical protein
MARNAAAGDPRGMGARRAVVPEKNGPRRSSIRPMSASSIARQRSSATPRDGCTIPRLGLGIIPSSRGAEPATRIIRRALPGKGRAPHAEPTIA